MRKIGFALASLLLTAAGPALAAPGDPLVVIGDGVNLRFEPSLDARIRARVYSGQRATELQREGDWVRVEIADTGGQEGWIHGSLLASPGGGPLARPIDAPPPPSRNVATPAADALPTTRSVAAAAAPPATPAAAPPAAPAAAPPAGPAAESADMAAAPAGEPPSPAPPTGPAPPVQAAIVAPASIEPAAAAATDPADLQRFRESVNYLNSRALSVAGVDLFTEVEAVGGGVVQVAATEAWSTIPPAGQQSYANTLLDRWAAARGGSGPVTVQIVDQTGAVLLESSRP